jgi:2-keto-3-deoxy-galactonokinase
MLKNHLKFHWQRATSGSAVIAAGLIWGLVAWVTAGSSAAPAAVAGYVASISAYICGSILQILNGI